jgi:toxin ParE1/3/4
VARRSANLTSHAKTDLAEIAAYYGEESVELELRFIDAAEAAFEKLLLMPEKGAKREYYHPKLQDLRMRPIPKFPKILIFYRPTVTGVRVVRVLHSARDLAALFSREKTS